MRSDHVFGIGTTILHLTHPPCIEHIYQNTLLANHLTIKIHSLCDVAINGLTCTKN